MTDQPIAFKDEMIRALFNETCPKTQTRRLNLEKQYYIGQKLWVKENWQTGAKLDKNNAAEIESMAKECGFVQGPFSPLFYPATQTHRRWCEADIRDFGNWGRVRIARFMPRWASRITLEVTALREERLQDISEEDAMAEGATIQDAMEPYRFAYKCLWVSINGPKSWDENPMVRVISFRRVDQTVVSG